jgi:hypothetical protein
LQIKWRHIDMDGRAYSPLAALTELVGKAWRLAMQPGEFERLSG